MQSVRRFGASGLVVSLTLGAAAVASMVWFVGVAGGAPADGRVDPTLLAAAPTTAAPVRPSRREATGADVDAAWVRLIDSRTSIPAPAVRAYGRAELHLRRTDPGCHLSWTTLAGIGWIESQHGTLGGRALRANGVSTSTVRGPQLDGTDYQAVRDGSGWAHAEGPLQFIPSTWTRWSADGDGDGRRNVDDIDDAALAAADYLCADSHDLATGPGWVAAIHSYNHSDAYVAQVRAAANDYAHEVG